MEELEGSRTSDGCGIYELLERKKMIWGWGDDKRLGDWGIVDRHRKKTYAEGFRDGIVVGCILSVAGGFALSWILGHYFK
jgi:hypothetical protein